MKKVVLCVRSQRKAPPYVEALKSVGFPDEDVTVVTAEDSVTRDANELKNLGREASGVVFAGGPDLDPSRYGEEPLPDANLKLLPELDEIEWPLLEGAQAGSTPTWAICRGMQLANVFLGGSLWQDLPSQLPDTGAHDFEEPKNHLAHRIEVTDRSTEFGKLLDDGRPEVNSRHHQAIKKLAPSLRPLAHAPDGVLEVVEHRLRHWWLRAVQWHPENLLGHSLQRRLWQDFADATADSRDSR